MRSSSSSASQADETSGFLNPETAVAEGLAANFEGTITAAQYEQFDWRGKAKPKRSGKSGVVMALHVTIDDRDDGEKAEDVYYDCGAIEDFIPADDGQSFTASHGATGFGRDKGVIQFSAAVVETGARKNSDLTGPETFVGLRFYWERKPPKWAKPGTAPGTFVDWQGKETTSTILVPSKFIGDVTKKGSKKSTPVASKAASRPQAAPEPDENENASGDEELTTLAVKLAMEALDDLPTDTNGVIGREELSSDVLGVMLAKYGKKAGANAIDKATRDAVGELITDEEFWAENAGKKTWKYNAKTGEVTA